MKGGSEAFQSAYRMGRLFGMVLCFGTPILVAALILSETVPPGRESPVGVNQQVGYLLTGLVFLAAAWVWWRSGRALRGFQEQPEAGRPALVLRESLLYAAALEVSSLCGLVYWMLVGTQAARHVWGFILMTPLLFLVLVPSRDSWARALES